MDEERFAQKLVGLTPAEQARAGDLIAGVVERDRIIARAEGEKAVMLAELAEISAEELPSTLEFLVQNTASKLRRVRVAGA